MAEAQAAAQEPQQDPARTQQPEQPPADNARPADKTYTQADLDRITAKVRKNAQRDAELRFRREQQTQQRPTEERPAEPKEEQEPARDKFEDYESYSKALAAYEGRKAAREERAKEKKEEQEKAQREQHEKAASTWKGKIEKAIAKHADFEDVLEDNQETMDLVYRSPMRAAITESDIGPEIVRHLCLNKEEVKRIAALPAYKQAAAIDRIETELLAAGKPAKKDEGDEDKEEDLGEAGDAKETDAERDAKGRFRKEQKDPPAPIEPGTGRSATNSALPSDKDDAETWRRKELARMRKREGK